MSAGCRLGFACNRANSASLSVSTGPAGRFAWRWWGWGFCSRIGYRRGRAARFLRLTFAETALPEAVTQSTWSRFFDEREPVHAFVAELDGRLVGLTHYLFHRSTTRIEDTCYLQDLFTSPEVRGRGVGRALIEATYAEADKRGCTRTYWTPD